MVEGVRIYVPGALPDQLPGDLSDFVDEKRFSLSIPIVPSGTPFWDATLIELTYDHDRLPPDILNRAMSVGAQSQMIQSAPDGEIHYVTAMITGLSRLLSSWRSLAAEIADVYRGYGNVKIYDSQFPNIEGIPRAPTGSIVITDLVRRNEVLDLLKMVARNGLYYAPQKELNLIP